MPTATLTRKLSCDGWVQTAAKQITADAFEYVEVSVGATDSDKQVDIAIDKSQLKAILIYSTDSDLMLEANAATSGGRDFVLNIDEDLGLVWTEADETNGYYTNPITADVTKFYVTNIGGVATTLHIGVLRDATP